MVKTFISERIKFRNTQQQKEFVTSCVTKLGGTNKVASILSVSERTIRDWGKAKFSIPYSSALTLSRSARVPFPRSVEKGNLTEHLRKIGTAGGAAAYKKYGVVGGDSRKRQIAWKAWWDTKGKDSKNPILVPKKVLLPPKNTLLAEFFGIMLGDGGVAPYHTSITLNATRDAAYADYIEKLLLTLFKVRPRRYKKKDENTIDIILHRKAIVQFCVQLGLPLGNKLKNPVKIPNWIIKNQEFAQACVRGLIDTDGSIFVHRYQSKGKKYSYVKIGFSSASPTLLDSVHEILANSAIEAKKKYTFREIRIENTQFVDRYMRIVGSHNPKHVAVWKKQRRGG